MSDKAFYLRQKTDTAVLSDMYVSCGEVGRTVQDAAQTASLRFKLSGLKNHPMELTTSEVRVRRLIEFSKKLHRKSISVSR